jgi:hypothetical protein
MIHGNCPVCNMPECFACEEKHCTILTKKNFGERKCPFFKTREQAEEEKEYCRQRMAAIKKGEV